MLILIFILKLLLMIFIACLFMSLFAINTFIKYDMYGEKDTKDIIKYRYKLAISFSIVPGINVLMTLCMFICSLLIIISKKYRESTLKNMQKKQ